MSICRLLAGGLIVLSLGCQYSRWALEDPDYARKYDQPPDLLDVPLQAKQAADARHVVGKGGWFVGGAGQTDPGAGGGEVGFFGYPTSWLSARASLALLAGTGADDLFYGLNLGLRAQAPTRLAPFVGVGVFNGFSEETYLAENDWIDNNDNGYIDERGEEDTSYGWLSAAYPEVGVHYWLSSDTRLTASAAYYVTTEGRDHDFWFFGGYLSFLKN